MSTDGESWPIITRDVFRYNWADDRKKLKASFRNRRSRELKKRADAALAGTPEAKAAPKAKGKGKAKAKTATPVEAAVGSDATAAEDGSSGGTKKKRKAADAEPEVYPPAFGTGACRCASINWELVRYLRTLNESFEWPGACDRLVAQIRDFIKSPHGTIDTISLPAVLRVILSGNPIGARQYAVPPTQGAIALVTSVFGTGE